MTRTDWSIVQRIEPLARRYALAYRLYHRRFRTSLPELLVSVTAALNNQIDMTAAISWAGLMESCSGGDYLPADYHHHDTLISEQLAKLPKDSNNTATIPWLVPAFIIMPISERMVIDNTSVLARFLA
ncbi:MAG: hypothetical protein GPOALKHO_001633 [Sodalis sp.]|nr:MAG: hypothetical protein GPOALKHO_001633 [Sodalis sp.]